MRYFTKLTLFLFLTLATLSCREDDTRPDLVTGFWIVQTLKPSGGQLISSEDIGFRLDFIDDGSFTLGLDANECGGIYAIHGESIISFDFPICTEKGGDSAEAFVFKDILTKGDTFSLEEGLLIISGSGGEIELNRRD